MFRKKAIIPLLAVITLLLLSACSNSADSAGAKQNSKPYKVQIANMGSSILELAKHKGWLEEELAKVNATVEWTKFTSGPPVIEALATKRADFGTLGEGAVLTAISGDVDLKLISLQSDGLKGINEIIVPKGSDIKQLADLKGKRIGVGKGTSNHVFLIKALKTAGLKESDVNLINLQVFDAQPAFESGQLDAWVAPDPLAYSEIHKNGAISIVTAEALNISSPTFYFLRGDFAKDHPEAAKILVQVVQQATDYQKANFEESIQISAEISKQDPAILKLLANNLQAQNTAISQEIVTELQASADTLLDLKFLKSKVDVSSVIDSSYLEQLQP